MTRTAQALTGLDVLQKDNFRAMAGLKVGLLVNQASVSGSLVHTVDVFAASKKVTLVSLFGPQHGIFGTTQDNMIEWEGFHDRRYGVPVHSLYGVHRKPSADMLKGIDAFVIDLVDVGARYYTFIWTAMLCLEACAQARIRVFVLDRPNPLGGAVMEGTVLKKELSSFVGLWDIPMRHGLTVGEILEMIRAEARLDVNLQVIPMVGWNRSHYFDETSLPWVMPSPNMPTLDTAIVYPGFCLLEGTNLSEGRGSTRPFEIFGAPFIDPYVLAEELRKCSLPGVYFRPLFFEPTFQKHAGKVCGGVQMHVTDRGAFKPVVTAVAALKVIHRLHPGQFKWKEPPYEYEAVKFPIDILAGNEFLRKQVEWDFPLDQIEESWQQELASFRDRRRPYLLYGGERGSS